MNPTENPVLEPLPQESADEFSLLDLATMLAQYWRILLFGPLVCGVVALGIAFIWPSTYTAKSVILPPQQQQSAAATALQSLGALAGIASSATGIKNPTDQYVALLQCDTICDRIVQRFDLKRLYDVQYEEDARKKLKKKVRVRAGLKDGLISIEVDDRDPRRAADMANAFVEELRRLLNVLAVTEAQLRRRFFEEKLAETRDNLVAAEKALQASGINEGAIRAEPKAAADSYAALRAQVTAAEVRVQAMRAYLTEQAPLYQQALAQLVALRDQLARTESASSKGAQGDYIARYRNFKYYETLFELMARQYELARIDESREGLLIQVVDVAKPPQRRSKPQRSLVAVLATLISGVILVLFVFVHQGWQNAAQNPETAEKIARIRRSFWWRHADR
jgi:uncharacterized protein involved in exopolysaccharide biosynthesis